MGGGVVADEADQAQIAEARNLDIALSRQRAAHEIRDDGDDHCQACGEPIPAARLAALPGAPRCADCQQIHEYQRRTIARWR